VYGADIIRRF